MDYLVKPWDHQRKAVEKSFELQHVALLFEPGTGKTFTAINFLRAKYALNKRVMKTLVFCPQVVIPNWKNEFAVFSRIDSKKILALTGTGKQREKRLKDFLYSEADMTYANEVIVILNYEAVQNEEIFNALLQWNPEIVVCDESHNLKDHGGKRAKAVFQLTRSCIHRYILTGTPILNTLMDVFMQYKILDNGDTFGQNFWVFRDRYFEDQNARWKGKTNYFPKWRPRQAMFEEFQKRLYHYGIRAVKSECLDLPPMVKTQRYVEVSSEQGRMLEQMKEDYLTFVDGLNAKGEKPVIVARLAMTKALRLQQIVSGFAKDDSGEIHRLKDVPRLKVLSDLLQDIVINQEQKVIVWSVFKENYNMIRELCEKLKIKSTELHGEISAKDKQENMALFTKGDAQVLIANQAAAGVGINLVEASYSIYYSKGFKLGDDIQSESRNFRGGSEIHEKITRIDLVALGTIDELVDEALRQKLNIADQILSWRDRL